MSPWERAYQQKQEEQRRAEMAERAQLATENGSLMGVLGVMVASAIGPKIAKKAGRKVIQMLGKRGSKQLKKVRDKANEIAESEDLLTGDAKEIPQRVYERAEKAVIKTTGDRLKYAAAKQGDRPKIDQFLSDADITDIPIKLRKGGRAYRNYSGSEKAKRGGTLRAFLSEDVKTQRKLARSFKDHTIAEQAIALPTAYTIDTQLGLTQAPSDRAMTDLRGQTEDFINYLPTYAMYEAGGQAAFGIPRALKPAGRELRRYAKNSPGLAKAFGNTYDRMSRAAKHVRDASAEFQNRFNHEVQTRDGVEQVRTAVDQTRDYYHRARTQAKGAVKGLFSGPEDGPHDVVRNSESLRAALEILGEESGLNKLQDTLRDASAQDDLEPGEVDAEVVLGKVLGGLFTRGEKSPLSRVARFFGGEAVTVGDLEDARKAGDLSLTDDAEESLSTIKQGIDRFKDEVDTLSKDPKTAIDEDLADSVKSDMSYKDLRVEGYTKIDGTIHRMPTGSDILAGIERTARRATRINVPGSRMGFSVSDVVGMGAFRGKRNTVTILDGSYPMQRGRDDRMVFFGDEGKMDVPESAREGGDIYSRGFAIKQSGLRKSRVYGQTKSGGFEDLGDVFMGSLGKGTVYRTAERRAMGNDETYARRPEDRIDQQAGQDPSFVGRAVDNMRKTLRLGTTEGGILRRTRDLLSKAAPRRLFGEDGALWQVGGLAENSTTKALRPIADALSKTRQAFINATSVYSREELMGTALRNIMDDDEIQELGGVQNILDDDQAALKAARSVLKNQDANINSDTNTPLRAPTAAKARSVVNEAAADPASLHSSASGERRADTLRRYLFEQGTLGTSNGQAQDNIALMLEKIDKMQKGGELAEDVALEAKAGLIGLQASTASKKQLTDPYRDLSNKVAAQFSKEYQSAYGVLQEHRDALEAFGNSRPRVDVSYNRAGYSDPDAFNRGYREGGFFMTDYSIGGATAAYFDAGFETMRRALSEVGLGWSPTTSVTTAHGRKELMKTWAKRTSATVGAALAYRVADGGTDLLLPDDAPLGEGISMEIADIAANSRLAASYLYDALGVTDAAQYMEGLMPNSSSIVPGALAGYYGTGGILGAVAGATLNRALQPILKDTPFEAFSILPPLAPFVSDMAESYEDTEAKYDGEKMVAQRKGRFYLFSGSNYEGGRIEQYRPNWYNQAKADVGATPVQYGSKLEEMIFKDLPLIDFAPGDLYDPQYLAKKHSEDRPFTAPDLPFSEVPVVGPLMGATVGRAYNMLHPAGNAPMTGTETLVGGFERGGNPAMGIVGGYGAQLGNKGFEGLSAYTRESRAIVGANSTPAILDEQFYRTTEAMGFLGFMTQQAAGGEGIVRHARMESASKIDSASRAYHDMEMGDMLGIGEAARRLMPYERGGAQYGPRNTMPDWMPDEFKYADPYCLAPETLVEVNDVLVEAEEVYKKVKEEKTLYTRTHKGNYKKITHAKKRDVDEPTVCIKAEGIPWKIRVTKEHPVWVYNPDKYKFEWKLAGDLTPEDELCEVIGPCDRSFVIGPRDRTRRAEEHPQTRRRDQELLAGIISLLETEPSASAKLSMRGLTDLQQMNINRGFGLEGSNELRRSLTRLSHLRCEMADYGLPLNLPGFYSRMLRPLFRRWGRVDKEEKAIHVTIPLADVRKQRSVWQAYKPYTSDVDDETLLRTLGYTLLRTCSAADIPGYLSIEDDAVQITLYGGSVKTLMASAMERRHPVPDVMAWGTKSPDVRHTGGLPIQVRRPVQSITYEDYEGPVYAFQVEDDESFTVAGIITHNSKVAMGEALLPGAGLEATGMLTGGDPVLEAKNAGRDVYETAIRTLGMKGGEAQSDSWAREATLDRLKNAGIAIRTEAAYVDEQRRMTAVADAATKSNNPIMIREVEQLGGGMTQADRERLNATLGAAGRSRGMQVYVDKTGAVETHTQEFDQQMYDETVAKLEAGRQRAKEYAAQGYGKPGAMYSTVDRLQVLQNAEPFGDAFGVEMRKAKKMYYGGMMSMEERAAFERITEQQSKMRLPFEMYDKRFNMSDLLTPSEKQVNMTYNEHVQEAAEYSLPERIAGSIYESAMSMRTPLHTKFFGNYSAEEQYERRVLYERDFQNWSNPVDDFIRPYAHGLAAADDPLQGAASFAVGGATFGNPAVGALGAAVGAAYGTARGAYEALGGNETFTPRKIEDMRQVTQQMDRIRYYRAKRLYDATGAKQYLDEMESTATGWTQSGFSGTGWAKDRRRSYGPGARLESDLYNTDQGFSSPWQGLRKIKGFLDALRKHSGDVLTLGNQQVKQAKAVLHRASEKMGLGLTRATSRRQSSAQPLLTADRSAKNVLSRTSQSRPSLAKMDDTAEGAAAGVTAGPMRDSPAMAQTGQRITGFSEGGMAKKLRSENTQVRSGLGFGSPYRGEDTSVAVEFHGKDPVSQTLPPEMLTAFGAAPTDERDFVRAFFMAEDEDRREKITDMVSEDMAAVLETGWNYMDGRSVSEAAMDVLPQKGMRADLTANPAMGLGADMEGYHIRSLEDTGIHAHDAGIGWQGAYARMEGARVQPAAIDSIADGTMREAPISTPELKMIIELAMKQIGAEVEVNIQEIAGPSVIHIYQE